MLTENVSKLVKTIIELMRFLNVKKKKEKVNDNSQRENKRKVKGFRRLS